MKWQRFRYDLHSFLYKNTTIDLSLATQGPFVQSVSYRKNTLNMRPIQSSSRCRKIRNPGRVTIIIQIYHTDGTRKCRWRQSHRTESKTVEIEWFETPRKHLAASGHLCGLVTYCSCCASYIADIYMCEIKKNIQNLNLGKMYKIWTRASSLVRLVDDFIRQLLAAGA